MKIFEEKGVTWTGLIWLRIIQNGGILSVAVMFTLSLRGPHLLRESYAAQNHKSTEVKLYVINWLLVIVIAHCCLGR